MKIKTLIETAKDNGNQLTTVNIESRTRNPNIYPSCEIKLQPKEKFQTFRGFGGAVTEASGYVLSFLPEHLRSSVIRSFYDSESGNGYAIARTHMNSCDFSLGNWACVEKKDETLSSFSMEQPDKYITPILTEASSYYQLSNKKVLSLMITPWSPPAWMKDNNDMNHGGHLKKEYLSLWAQYFVRYLSEMKKRGLNTQFVSVQNEPAAVQTWDSCIWSAQEEAEFAVKYLRPALDKAGFDSTGILVWDHNRDLLLERFSDSMSVDGADKAIAGACYHWYMGANYQNVAEVAKRYPNKELVFSEGCIEGGSRNGAWFSGERYAHNIINDLNSGCTMWIDWNIALDMVGGPNHVGNFCDATVLVDTDKKQVNYQSSYYYIGQFSRFIKPGAVRLGCKITGNMTPATVDGIMQDTMESCAFINTDGTIALVVCNRTEADMNYRLDVDGNSDKPVVLCCPPRAIQTVLIQE